MIRPALDGLARDFNDGANSDRLVLLVSPSCPRCLTGVGLVAAELASNPAADIRVLVLWVLALPSDSAVAAEESATIVGVDPRVSPYWEENDGWTLATAFRPVLGLGALDPEVLAWDVYLLYRRGIRWKGSPPPPTAWAYNFEADVNQTGVRRIDGALLQTWLEDRNGGA